MDLKQPLTAADVAAMIGAKALGNTQRLVTGINEINRIREGDLLFVDHPKYYAKALNSSASVVLINKDDVAIPEGKAIIFCTDPCAEYNKLVAHFSPRLGWGGMGPSIGENSQVHPTAVIGPEVRIGKDCNIMPGVVIYGPADIGDRVTIHANTVLGADPFYFKKRATGYDKMIPCGSVVIEDDVEIGALCTIDRGVSADTRIGRGTKMDNHVQVGPRHADRGTMPDLCACGHRRCGGDRRRRNAVGPGGHPQQGDRWQGRDDPGPKRHHEQCGGRQELPGLARERGQGEAARDRAHRQAAGDRQEVGHLT